MSNNNFANPQAPSNYVHPQKDDSGPMTNEDFRKLLMTPSIHTVRSQTAPQTVRGTINSAKKKKLTGEAAEKRKEKKLYYAALVKESQEKQKELAEKYRDRAKERREKEKDGENELDQTELLQTGYRAVAPGFSLTDNAERRRQIIEESKYLGGDLEHTHLVKGLDYALLQKIREQSKPEEQQFEEDDETLETEILKKKLQQEIDEEGSEEDEIENEEDKIKSSLKPKILPKTQTAALAAALNKSLDTPFAFKKKLEAGKSAQDSKSKKLDQDENEESVGEDGKIIFKTKTGRNVYRVLFENNLPKSNDLFLPNRMAYIVDLNDEETDVPITSIRSKAECTNNEENAILTTNDIVINKLTQILSYLRHGKRDGKKLKKKVIKTDEIEIKKDSSNDLGIYDDIGDYVPDFNKKNKSEAKQSKTKNYFDIDENEESLVQAPTKEVASEFIRNINQKYANKELETEKKEEKKAGMNISFDPDSYAECYPGTNAEEDVNFDSDEEADFSKMDMGNKKGPVNRWDFDTNEEYGNYMSNKEALPKAAFQFGVKMNEGRKTRRGQNDQKEKAKLEKEWASISKIIEKRKAGENSGEFKKPKY
ncbi:Red [Brachionus plicatilis]|uniref:Red n=1 Tax=Brachionus plicatilis TaxID=10195 RepID=A0A3M7RYI2_BRAPC|nr:Red [Brachionus plicatilis]